jgi:hypothetical protein
MRPARLERATFWFVVKFHSVSFKPVLHDLAQSQVNILNTDRFQSLHQTVQQVFEEELQNIPDEVR